MRMSCAKYIAIGRTELMNSFVYAADTIAGSLFVGLIIFIFINLWKAVFPPGGLIEGFTIGMMLWYLVMSESIVTCHARLLEDIGLEIVSGRIANHLSKPYNFLIYKYASTLGRALFKFCITFLVGASVVLIFIGGTDISLVSIPAIIFAAFLAITLHFSLMALLGVLTFWIEDAKSLYFLYQKIVFTIGGMLLPLEIFPQWLGRISAALPFSYIAYHPARLFVKFSLQSAFQVITFQLIWIVVSVALASLLYMLCIRKVSVNGG